MIAEPMISVGGLGSPAQVGTFVVVLLAGLRLVLPWRKLTLDSETQIRKELTDRVKELKQDCKDCHTEAQAVKLEAADAVQKCREDCDKQTSELKQELLARDRQRVQEQISIIGAIMNSVGDNPQLAALLKTFESVQVTMKSNVLQTQAGFVIPKSEGEPGE